MVLNNLNIDYRKMFGVLFTALSCKYGPQYFTQIEDAIQNAFYKSLKCAHSGKVPDSWENWLFIVARNDLLTQISRDKRSLDFEGHYQTSQNHSILEGNDHRLLVLIYFIRNKEISIKAKIAFVLRCIFGLSVEEIGQVMLTSKDAVAKMNTRSKGLFKSLKFESLEEITNLNSDEIQVVEEILYAVFNIGYDSFNPKVTTTFNDDLCMEALAMGILLTKKYGCDSTSNMVSLFCFHLGKVGTKIHENRLISFFDQNSEDWNYSFIQLGFHYLIKPKTENRYYLESIIVSKHMLSKSFDEQHWNSIIYLYDQLFALTASPVIILNKCYCLSKVGKRDEAIHLLKNIGGIFPENHFYYNLIKADLFKNQGFETEARSLIGALIKEQGQEIRFSLLENW